VPHADYLFADGAGAPYRSQGFYVLPYSMDPRQPVDSPVLLKTTVFGNDKGLLKKVGDLVQR
jgi:hypothetical protein